MTRPIIFILLAAVAGTLRAQESAQGTLAREVVDSAIARAKASDKEEALVVRPGHINISGTGFVVEAEGPGNRVANYARRMIKKYLPVVPESIPASLREPTFKVVATPLDQVTARSFKGELVTPAATHVVLAFKDGDGEKIVQPLSTESFEIEVAGISNDERDVVDAYGRVIEKGKKEERKHFTSKGIRASFPMGAIPQGDFEIRIVTDAKEFRVAVDGKRRAVIRD